MKRLLGLMIVFMLLPSFASAQFTVPQGGTGSRTFPLNSLIYFNGTRFVATSTNPLYVGSIFATSSNTSTFTVAPTFTSLTSALVLTGAGGLTAEYTGTTCTNQFVSALSVLGVATCATVDISANTNLTAGDALTLTGDDIDFDGGTAPGGELGGTWASPTIDDSLTVTGWNLGNSTSTNFFSGTLTSNTFSAGQTSTTSIDSAGNLTVGSLSGNPLIAFDGTLGSTTMQKLTATHSTTTNATSTNLFSTNASTTNLWLALGACDTLDTDSTGKVICGSDATGAGGGTFPFDVQTWGNSTTTTLGFLNGFMSTASSTLTATATAKAINFNANKENVSASQSTGGVVNINRGTNLGPGLVVYTNAGTGGGRLVSVFCDDPNLDTQCLHVGSDSTLETTLNVLGSPAGKGIVKIGSNGVGDADSSALSMDCSLSSFIGQCLFIKGNNTGKLLNIRNGDSTELLTLLPRGGLGLGTTTPYFQLQIASSTGPQVALSSADSTSSRWNFRAVGETFALATSSASTFATSSTPVFRVDSTNTVTFGNSLATCIALTGSATLCDGSDDGAGGTANSKWATTTVGDGISPGGATKVGIGTTTPFSTLSVSTTSANILNLPLFTVASSSHATIFTVTGNDRVGIGTTSPFSTLAIESTGATQLNICNGVGTACLLMGFTSSGNQAGVFGTQTNAGFFLQTNAQNRIAIRNDGTVGIGTTTPQWIFSSFSSSAPQLSLSHGAGFSQWVMRNDGSNFAIATTTVAGTATSSVTAFKLNANGFPVIPSLANCNTIDTDANGLFTCGADATGAGGGGEDFSYSQDIGYGLTGSATSTKTKFIAGLIASSTNFFDYATTTAFTVTGTSYFGGAARPTTNDGAALGTGAAGWSDLFLASGAVINWDSNLTLTHSLNALTLSAGDLLDLGGAALEIPNSTSFTIATQGQVNHDTTANVLEFSTSTVSTSNVVFGSATTTLYAFTVASTSADFISGGIIELPSHFLAQTAIGVICDADAGTSVVINLSDGTNDTNTATCTTTETQFAFTTNQSFTAYEDIRLEVGTITGTVDRLSIRVIGYRQAP